MKCRRRGSDAKVVARVLAIGVECDLALLAVDGDDADEFWRGLQGVTLCRSLPRLQESVSVCGFPLGGDTLSVSCFLFVAFGFLQLNLYPVFFLLLSPLPLKKKKKGDERRRVSLRDH